MKRVYRARLRGDRLEWVDRPAGLPATADVEVIVAEPETVLKSDPASPREPNGRRIADLAEQLAKLDPFRDIEDPVAWQREIRKDRPLPGRSE